MGVVATHFVGDGRDRGNVLLLLVSLLTTCIISTFAEAGEVVIERTLSSLSVEELSSYYDENGKLNTHLLLFPELCLSVVENEYFNVDFRRMYDSHGYNRHIHPVSGEAEELLFGYLTRTENFVPTKDSCSAVCVERGMDKSQIQYIMPHLRYDEASRVEHNGFFNDWYFLNCERVEFVFLNYYSEPEKHLDIYWRNPDTGELVYNREIRYGEFGTAFLGTYLGHQFVFIDPETNQNILEHTVEFAGSKAIGTYPVPQELKQRYNETQEDQVLNLLTNEWHRHKRVRRTFTNVGFSRGRLPDDLYAQMAAFYYNNRNHKYAEEGQYRMVFINWWESDLYFIQIPWRLKEIWQARLLELVQDWVGPDVPLEQTDLYGMRQYSNGARLLSHVDREETHAASLIVNIAQLNIVEPWRVEIHDHADRLHEIAMEPGDIVYYESARCLHGRETPMRGQSYVNLFTHYRPVGNPNWYLEDNPEGAPQPLMDIGECRLTGEAHEYSGGSVQCDDKRIGLHLSPKLFTAQHFDDLFDYWKSVGPKPDYVDVGVESQTAVQEEL